MGTEENRERGMKPVHISSGGLDRLTLVRLTGQGSVRLRRQVDASISEGAPTHAVLGPDLVLVGLGILEVLNQQHPLLGVVDLYFLWSTHRLCKDTG